MQKKRVEEKEKIGKKKNFKVGSGENWTGNLWTIRWRDRELYLETGNQYGKPRKHGTTSVTNGGSRDLASFQVIVAWNAGQYRIRFEVSHIFYIFWKFWGQSEYLRVFWGRSGSVWVIRPRPRSPVPTFAPAWLHAHFFFQNVQALLITYHEGLLGRLC